MGRNGAYAIKIHQPLYPYERTTHPDCLIPFLAVERSYLLQKNGKRHYQGSIAKLYVDYAHDQYLYKQWLNSEHYVVSWPE